VVMAALVVPAVLVVSVRIIQPLLV
jgi:hypothetical protein